MTLTADDLLDLAAHNGVRVRYADLGSISGYYEDAPRRISLHICLTQYQERSTLAHEMSHARWRDCPTADDAEHERRERRADAEAARLLIAAADYAAAERAVGPDPGALAIELGVSRWVIDAFRREADAGRAWTRPAS